MREAVSDELVCLATASQARDEADRALREAVQAARDAGATWHEIGQVLGVAKQTAWERFWRGVG